MSNLPIDIVVLAGERPGGNALAQALSLPSALLAPVAGKTVIQWTFDALFAANHARLALVGPTAALVEQHQAFASLASDPRVQWLEPQAGPAASAVHGIERLDRFPILLTAADHALLQGVWVDQFVDQAKQVADATQADIVIGLVAYNKVRAAFPGSKRTLLRFSNASFCGSNLFFIAGPRGVNGIRYWRKLEQLRKSPWRIASAIGVGLCVRYLLGRLSSEQAMVALSEAAGCKVRVCELTEPRLAVDVDSQADFQLANRLLSQETRVD